MLLYVDDIIVTRNSPTSFITKINVNFTLKHLGNLACFLGIETNQQRDHSLFLSHAKYIRDLLSKDNLDEAKGIRTPMLSNLEL